MSTSNLYIGIIFNIYIYIQWDPWDERHICLHEGNLNHGSCALNMPMIRPNISDLDLCYVVFGKAKSFPIKARVIWGLHDGKKYKHASLNLTIKPGPALEFTCFSPCFARCFGPFQFCPIFTKKRSFFQDTQESCHDQQNQPRQWKSIFKCPKGSYNMTTWYLTWRYSIFNLISINML